MRLADVLREEYIITDLEAREKKELLNEMVSVIMVIETELDRDSVLRALLERERLGTTGIGHGVAIPHGRVKGLRDLKVFFGRSRKGVNFDSMDKLPVHLFFLIMAPENSASAHLKVLASISQLLKNQEFRTRLLTADTRSEIYRAIVEAEIRGSVL
ncbi:MAG TPA: PTS fructose transporter subunit IIA [Deltaproteobacteria bacterium]|nr:MAG: PTS fructose transporter subunit IIA [Deltaproteobacteria bacterium GWA2_55_82]OGQ62215.1 MAG: PTS fructose transporter subunit IIA [Deltaproteobacteria bacterium RIFCSPLOWO2_02_FULL_55_12]OIJ73256.1 MAG: PTS fructose transporter subunit IIA [Deltaproteobacteria bacterium GWC2_55_46]HBG45480.1 PTS fructose transporter subunit IIA [Deltaproteobacteria bacterium]HCY10311.1 PTS fructose transporter subunit IIA [Deltaproteobacteria bacterium]